MLFRGKRWCISPDLCTSPLSLDPFCVAGPQLRTWGRGWRPSCLPRIPGPSQFPLQSGQDSGAISVCRLNWTAWGSDSSYHSETQLEGCRLGLGLWEHTSVAQVLWGSPCILSLSIQSSCQLSFDGVKNHVMCSLSYKRYYCALWFSHKSCLTLCDPMEYSLPGSSVHGISPARIQEWIAISFSRGSSWPRDQTHVSCVSCIADGFFTRWAIREFRLFCPLLSPRVCSNSCPLSQWCYLTISSSAIPFSFCLQSFPASGSFKWVECSHKTASVLPMNIQS